MMTKYGSSVLLSVAILSMSLSACGKKKERVEPFERCEKIFKIIAPDVGAATGMCNCMKSKLGMKGVAAFGTVGSPSDKERKIIRACAKENGLDLPGTSEAGG